MDKLTGAEELPVLQGSEGGEGRFLFNPAAFPASYLQRMLASLLLLILGQDPGSLVEGLRSERPAERQDAEEEKHK